MPQICPLFLNNAKSDHTGSHFVVDECPKTPDELSAAFRTFSFIKYTAMLEQVHKHITEELGQNTRTDIIFILTAIALNLLTLAINSGFAVDSREESSHLIVMFLFVALIVLVNIVAIFGLLKGKQTRSQLLNGLLNMYRDQQVDKYYDPALLGNYNTRYNLFILVVVFTGVISIVVPFVIR
ncbi:MAG: hypothetical protein WA004_01140 [Saprospiraceae bacterium]